MSSSRFYSLLFFIVLLFVALHMIKFGHRWVDDESWYTMPITSIQEESKFRIPTVPGNDVFWAQPPLLTYLESLTDSLVGLSPKSARVVPLLFGIGLLLLVGLIGRQVGGYMAGLLATFLVGADNLVFLAIRTVRPEIMISFFMLAGLLVTSKLANRYEIEGKSFSVFSYILLFLIFASAIASHANGVLVPLCAGIFWLIMVNKPILERVKGFVTIGVLGVLAVSPFALWVAFFDYQNNFEVFKGMWIGRYGRHVEDTGVWSLVLFEWNNRYQDFIQFPYRVHIAIASVVTLIFSLFSKNRYYRALACLVVIQLLFFIFVNNSNETVRYLVISSPIIAIIWAIFISGLISNLEHKFSNLFSRSAAIALVLVLGVSQLLGNMLYLWKFKDADYYATSDEIKSHLEDDDIVYGSMSFWLGLREHSEIVPYIRMGWASAVKNFNANTVVLNDRVMVGHGKTWENLKAELECYQEYNGVKVGEVHNSFYGDMTIFRVKDKDQHQAAISKCGIER